MTVMVFQTMLFVNLIQYQIGKSKVGKAVIEI